MTGVREASGSGLPSEDEKQIKRVKKARRIVRSFRVKQHRRMIRIKTTEGGSLAYLNEKQVARYRPLQAPVKLLRSRDL